MTWLRRLFIRPEAPVTVVWEPSCVVSEDWSAVTRHARPMTEADRAQVREQHIATLRRDDAAVLAREIRIASERHKIVTIRRRA